jgi:hypothetical protein
VPAPPVAALTDPRLIGGVADITAMIAAQLADGASPAEEMPSIRDATRRWLEQNVRSGQPPASAGSPLDQLAAAVHDRRYGLGPLSVYLRNPHVENVDINDCDQNLPDSPTDMCPVEDFWPLPRRLRHHDPVTAPPVYQGDRPGRY